MRSSAARRARVFRSGNSQAVRLPREVRFPAEIREVRVTRDGARLILDPVAPERFDASFWAVLGSMPEFRRPPQKRRRRKALLA
ncbi:MAG: AbrB/MazE/SpoVT family DNA-binding domain-containing protein [Planctomycetes bacterium]|nr:AbrB/MazE/SpoVT family DNA-binding domain-containing protein [Planctomycetota bacterium]